MMESLQRYRALGAADRWLVAEAAVLLVVVRLAIAGVPFSILRRALDRAVRLFGRHAAGTSVSSVTRLAWAVAAVAPRLPFRSTCLVEALAIDAMLRRRGHASEIRIGVRPPSGGALAGHAWVEHDGIVVFGALQELADYAVLSAPEAE